MRKPPKPWQRANRGGDWYVTLKGKQIFLAAADSTPEQVQRAYGTILSGGGQAWGLTVSALVQRYLEFIQKNFSVSTLRIRRKALEAFSREYPAVAPGELKPFQVREWLDKASGPTVVRLNHASVLAMLNWAVEQGYLEKNPLSKKLKLPPVQSRGRKCFLSEDLYRMVLEGCRYENYRLAVIALWGSGVRPSEFCNLGVHEGTWADIQQGVWRVFGKAGYRLVKLTQAATEATRRSRELYPEGAVFRNKRGQPWHRYSIMGMLERVRKKQAKKYPSVDFSGVTTYSFRHSFATNRLIEGESASKVASYLGHKSTQILEKYYNHMQVEDLKGVLDNIKPLQVELEYLKKQA